jgi:extracellular elastinolytic metalloproteinase
MPKYAGMYRTIVDADTGEILYCKQLIKNVAAQGNIYRVDGGGSRQITDFPRPLIDYGLPIPDSLSPGFPATWVAKDETVGNCINAHLDNGGTCKGQMQNQVMTFNPGNAVGDDQRVLNAFYLCCYMHDFFYLLGFREVDGNFQQDNFNLGGNASDRVDAVVFLGAVWGTANMGTPIDGQAPRMNLGLMASTNRHTALDSSIVFHEFTHGVNKRLIGGPMNVNVLDPPQSSGMDEGWADYIACTINRTTVVGAWISNNANGLRAFAYDSNFPDNFGHLGTGRYTECHNIGEIWCATLMEMNRNIGANLGVQLIVDALKLTPANPSFLDGRDAILKALEYKKAANQLAYNEYIVARNGIWKAFAKFGMGPKASSNGAQLSGIVVDFSAKLETLQELVTEAILGRMV